MSRSKPNINRPQAPLAMVPQAPQQAPSLAVIPVAIACGFLLARAPPPMDAPVPTPEDIADVESKMESLMAEAKDLANKEWKHSGWRGYVALDALLAANRRSFHNLNPEAVLLVMQDHPNWVLWVEGRQRYVQYRRK